MTREQIKKAAKEYADSCIESCPDSLKETYIDMLSDPFIAGAEHVLNHLCSIPWDKAMRELYKYAKGRKEEYDKRTD